jgi:hypothetical protein
MLSENDIHYITGFLYVASEQQKTQVVLGQKVYDVASESKRDVDIVVATAGHVGFIAAEVKDESRPLDVSVIEAICRKFQDMPEIRTRAIVSTSGFTKPARRKGAAHGVSCLTLVRAAVPPFPTVNVTLLKNMVVSYPTWLEGPHVTLAPTASLSEEERSMLSDELVVSFPDGSHPGMTLRELADRLAKQTPPNWEAPAHNEPTAIQFNFEIEEQPLIRLGPREVIIRDAVVRGVIQQVPELIPLEASCYLADEADQPFAATVLFKIRSGLIGFAVSTNSTEFRTYHIPDAARATRPVGVPIFGSAV